MNASSAPIGPDGDRWTGLLPLFREINDLKRIRSPELRPSIAAAWFRRAASALFHSPEPASEAIRRHIAVRVTADVVSATRLGAITDADLGAGGLDSGVIRDLRTESIRERREALDAVSFAALVDAIGMEAIEPSAVGEADHDTDRVAADGGGPAGSPDWIERLIAQPRAGATAPGQPRIVLEPVESCAEHCLVTAAYAVLLAPSFEADPGDAFVIALAHHLHNARLPDAGFAGEALIGEHLDELIATLRRDTLAMMSPGAATHLEPLLLDIGTADSPLARTFHTADTIDRVLQIEYFSRCNDFTLDDALVGMELVHAGPIQTFQQEQLDMAGLGQA